MSATIRSAFILFIAMTLLTGVLYPLGVTLVAQVVFPKQANGSLIVRDGKIIGSELIAQPFDDQKYFWGRPSGTSPFSNNSASSSGSNLGPTNPDLSKAIGERIATIRDAHPEKTGPIPVDLVTASGSGLDPHISPAAADFQVERVAKVRELSVEQVRKLVTEHTEGRTFGVLGESRVNVLKLNLALDALAGANSR